MAIAKCWKAPFGIGRHGRDGEYVAPICGSSMARSIGEWGSPSYAQWVTREASDGAASRCASPIEIARSRRTEKPQMADATGRKARGYPSVSPQKRKSGAIIDDPRAVSAKVAVISHLLLLGAPKSGARKGAESPLYIVFFGPSNNPEDMAGELLANATGPACLYHAVALTLPPGLVRLIVRSAKANEMILFIAKSMGNRRVTMEMQGHIRRVLVARK